MNHGGLPTLRFLSHNVNGMRGAVRRRLLFSTLLDEGYDIVALQETHQAADTHAPPPGSARAVDGDEHAASTSEGDEWAREGAGPTRPWPGTAFWAPSVLGRRGVALLFFFFFFFFFFRGESPLHVRGHAETNLGGPNAVYQDSTSETARHMMFGTTRTKPESVGNRQWGQLKSEDSSMGRGPRLTARRRGATSNVRKLGTFTQD